MLVLNIIPSDREANRKQIIDSWTYFDTSHLHDIIIFQFITRSIWDKDLYDYITNNRG